MKQSSTFEGRQIERNFTGAKILRKLKDNKKNTVRIGSPPKDLIFSEHNKFRVGPPP